MHPTLNRQLKRVGLSEEIPPNPDQWRHLLDSINDAYQAADNDRYLTERSLSISSREMTELHSSLSHERDRMKVIIDSLDDAIVVFDKDLKVEQFNPGGTASYRAKRRATFAVVIA